VKARPLNLRFARYIGIYERDFWIMSIIIDANASFEYTSRSYTLHFAEEGAVVVLDAVKYLLVPKILYGVINLCNLLYGH